MTIDCCVLTSCFFLGKINFFFYVGQCHIIFLSLGCCGIISFETYKLLQKNKQHQKKVHQTLDMLDFFILCSGKLF